MKNIDLASRSSGSVQLSVSVLKGSAFASLTGLLSWPESLAILDSLKVRTGTFAVCQFCWLACLEHCALRFNSWPERRVWSHACSRSAGWISTRLPFERFAFECEKNRLLCLQGPCGHAFCVLEFSLPRIGS